MKFKFLVLIILGFIFVALALSWWKQALKPMNSTNTTVVSFSIAKGEGIKSIANRLNKTGLVRSTVAFYLYTRFWGLADSVQAGDFFLSPSMNLSEIVKSLQHGTGDILITIPEGWRNEEIALKLAQEISLPEAEFLKVASSGYMFPDTYRIPKEASVGAIIRLFQKNFDGKIKTIKREAIESKGLELNDIIIIASLVEREARYDEDRPLIASVILNRLKIGMKLDIDATIQYALGYQPNSKSWWKRELTSEDLVFDSPFNTYMNPGLPPSPIANPGLSSINSVINAPATSFLYYIADKSGKSHFAETIEKHNENIAKYLNK